MKKPNLPASPYSEIVHVLQIVMPFKKITISCAVLALCMSCSSLFAENNSYPKPSTDGVHQCVALPTDSMSAKFMGKLWKAESFRIDTVSEEIVGYGQHQFMFELIGINDKDTLKLSLPTLIAASRMVDPAILSSMPSTTSHMRKYYYGGFMQLDTGTFNVDIIPWVDYTPSFDAQLGISVPEHIVDGKPVNSEQYFSYAANKYNPKGYINISFIDSNTIIGSFSFDVSQAGSPETAKVTDGYFRFSFRTAEEADMSKLQSMNGTQ